MPEAGQGPALARRVTKSRPGRIDGSEGGCTLINQTFALIAQPFASTRPGARPGHALLTNTRESEVSVRVSSIIYHTVVYVNTSHEYFWYLQQWYN